MVSCLMRNGATSTSQCRHTLCFLDAYTPFACTTSILIIIPCQLNSGTPQGCGINFEGQGVLHNKGPKVLGRLVFSAAGRLRSTKDTSTSCCPLVQEAIESCQEHLDRLLSSHAGGPSKVQRTPQQAVALSCRMRSSSIKDILTCCCLLLQEETEKC